MANIIIKGPKDSKHPDSRLYGQIAFILMRAGVIGADIDACLEWAFGKGCLYEPPCNWPARWNKLHPRATQIKGKDSFVEIMMMVGFYYAMQKKKAEIAGKN